MQFDWWNHTVETNEILVAFSYEETPAVVVKQPSAI